MKKVFLSLAVAAALLLGSKAQAQVPEWINFQGVCSVLSGTPTVHFVILDEDGNDVYAETQKVTTNAKGQFTAKIGDGEPADMSVNFDALEWAGKTYTLNVDINGTQVATGVAFGSVPYALVAESIGSLSSDNLDNILENLEGLVPVIEKYVTDTDNLIDALNGEMGIYDQIAAIVKKNMEQQSDIEDLKVLTKDLDETQQDVIELSEKNMEHQHAINWLMEKYTTLLNDNSTYGGIALENHTAIEAIQLGLDIAQSDIIEIVELNKEQQAAIIDLQALTETLANGLEVDEQTIQEIIKKNMDQQTEINELQEQQAITAQGLADAEESIKEIVLYNIQQQTDINTLRDEFDKLSESLEFTIPVLQQMEDNVETLLKHMEWSEEQIAEIVALNMNQQTELNELRIDVNGALELVNRAGTVAYTNAESILEINEKLDAQYTELNDLRVLVRYQGETIGSLQTQVERLTDIVNSLRP